MTVAEHVALASTRRPPSARPWPSLIRPSAIAAWTSACEVEQPERVGDGRPGPPDPLGDLVLGEPELVDQLAVGERLLDRVEVGALDVLDEGELELVAVGELADERRDPLEAGQRRGAQRGARRRRAGSRRGSR